MYGSMKLKQKYCNQERMKDFGYSIVDERFSNVKPSMMGPKKSSDDLL